MSVIALKKVQCQAVPLFTWREFSAIETREELIELTSNPVKLRNFRQRVASSSIPVNMMPNGVAAPGKAQGAEVGGQRSEVREDSGHTGEEEVVS